MLAGLAIAAVVYVGTTFEALLRAQNRRLSTYEQVSVADLMG